MPKPVCLPSLLLIQIFSIFSFFAICTVHGSLEYVSQLRSKTVFFFKIHFIYDTVVNVKKMPYTDQITKSTPHVRTVI